VIRNVVVHVANEQPLLADLYGLPTAGDSGMLCTNLRMPDGKRPIFVDDQRATFFFPYLHIRFVEIPTSAFRPEGADTVDHGDDAALVALDAGATNGRDDEPDLELDEEFLRKIRDL